MNFYMLSLCFDGSMEGSKSNELQTLNLGALICLVFFFNLKGFN